MAKSTRLKDEVGNTYGYLTVYKFDEVKKGNAYWWVACDCGHKFSTRGCDLRNGSTTSCGCKRRQLPKDMARMGKNIAACEIVEGAKFYRITLLNKTGKRYWNCRCDCGNNILVHQSELLTRSKQHCGCLQKQDSLTDMQLYNLSIQYLVETWERITHAGACSDWTNSFNEFANWAFENGFEFNKVINRKDLYKDFSPTNTTWK